MNGYMHDDEPGDDACEDYEPEYSPDYDDEPERHEEVGLEDFDSESDRKHWSTEELQQGDWFHGYDEFNEAHAPSWNPWIEEFGPGEEAETAYWKTN